MWGIFIPSKSLTYGNALCVRLFLCKKSRKKVKKVFQRCKNLARLIAKIQASRAKEVRKVTANERRLAMLETLCERRHESIENLAFEFGVSVRTVKYDIEALTLSYPIYTSQGNGGGVHVVDGYYIGRKYLKPNQKALLEQLSETLTGEDAKTMREILKTFALEIPKKD